MYRIAGNFQGRKLSRISRFFSHPRKFSPRNSRHATPIMRPVLTFRESFLREMLLSYRSAKVFSLENFPLYGIHYCIGKSSIEHELAECPPESEEQLHIQEEMSFDMAAEEQLHIQEEMSFDMTAEFGKSRCTQ